MSTATLPPPVANPEMNRLGSRLTRAGLISQEELQAALHEQHARKSKLGETLVALGFIDEQALLTYLGSQLEVPACRLRDGLIDPKVVRLIPRPTAEQIKAIALFKVRQTLTVAMAEPQDLPHVDELERVTNLTIRPVFASRSDIDRMIARAYEDGFSVDAVTADVADDEVTIEHEVHRLDLHTTESLAEGSPIISLVNLMLVQAIRNKASDVHIEPGQQHSTVRYRIDGLLREMLRPRNDFHAAIISRIKVMAALDIAEHRQPQDGRIHVRVEGQDVDIRVSTLPTVLGEKAVLRILDRRNLTFDLDKLGVPDAALTQVKRMLARPHGLVLVTGPTGSGKTTTLYSALELIKSVHRNIVTVEDPVEYQIELVNQVQIESQRGVSFAGALRSILRQDPDVIMVGEIRDAETAQVAVQAALTGHLVLSTLHTNDCCGAITRLTDMGIVPYKIAAAIVGVIAQRLMRKVCPSCRSFHYPPEEVLSLIEYEGDRRRQFVRGEGCRDCHDTGFQGRRGIYEVLTCTREIRDLICKGASVDALKFAHRHAGGRTLLDEAIRMAEGGETSLDEVVRVAFSD